MFNDSFLFSKTIMNYICVIVNPLFNIYWITLIWSFVIDVFLWKLKKLTKKCEYLK